MLGGMCFFVSNPFVSADVYLDSKTSLSDNTDALVSVLSDSVVPGGVRSVSLNGSDLLVRRFANPAGDNSEFYEVWKKTATQKKNANMDIFSVLDAHDPILAALTQGAPYESPVKNLPYFLSVSEEFAKSQTAALKTKVVDAIETPFSYETNQHRVIAKIPIKSIDADSSLANKQSDDGFLFLSEKSSGTTISNAFWQIEFGENFIFTDLFASNGEDVKGEEAAIARYPGSVMSMSYSESAKGWNSQSWSYESTGDVLSHILHYINAFEQAGFSKDNHSVVQSDYGLVQFANPNKEATLFVEVVDALAHSVQITLQVRSN